MKVLLLIATGILLLIFLFQGYTIYSSNQVETQEYKVLKKDGIVEIRYYPSAVMATVEVPGGDYKNTSGNGFRQLAGYIFGSNKSSEKIAMTAPVHMEDRDSISVMSFIMPSEYSKDELPIPSNENIKIHESEAAYVAAIQFGGFVDDATLKEKKELLKKWLIENDIKFEGNFRYLGYNPPYQLVGRRNEVVVKITEFEGQI